MKIDPTKPMLAQPRTDVPRGPRMVFPLFPDSGALDVTPLVDQVRRNMDAKIKARVDALNDIGIGVSIAYEPVALTWADDYDADHGNHRRHVATTSVRFETFMIEKGRRQCPN